MSRLNGCTLRVCAVATGVAVCTAVAAGQTWQRTADWVPGTAGSVSGSPGPTGPAIWIYEYTSGGGASNSANPWYTQPSTPMVWDDNWFNTGRGVWAQADDVNPPVDQNRYAHNVAAIAIHSAPIVRFKNPTTVPSMFTVTGTLKVVWDGTGGIGRPNPVDVIMGKQDALGGNTSVLLSSTVLKPNNFASIGDFVELQVNLGEVTLAPGESLILSHRGRNAISPGGWITMYDNLNVGLIPTPGAAALLGMGGLMAMRRRRR